MKNMLLVLLGFILATPSGLAAETMGPPVPSAVDTGVVQLTKDNTLSINDMFDGETVSAIIKLAKELDSRIPSGDPLYLVLNSPGGYIDAGLELIENLSSLKRPVHTITIQAASMGFQTVQGLGDRLLFKNGTLMSHKARGGVSGEFPGQLDSRYAFELKRVIRMDEQAVKRTKGKYTLDSYHTLIQNEFWCDGQECVDKGFADKVISASCDKSLEGTKQVPVIQEIIMGHALELKAEYDICPLNSNALKYNVFIDGQPLFKASEPSTVTDVKRAKEDALSSMFFGSYGGYSSSTKTAAESLTKDELFEINRRVQTLIKERQSRKVFYGY